jgi:hypothetical protein
LIRLAKTSDRLLYAVHGAKSALHFIWLLIAEWGGQCFHSHLAHNAHGPLYVEHHLNTWIGLIAFA